MISTDGGGVTEEDRCLRKLRKKLRQIEHLELLDRELNDEEISKVTNKDGIRRELGRLVQAMKRRSDEAGEAAGKRSSAGDVSNKRKCLDASALAAAAKVPSPSILNQEEQLEISVPNGAVAATQDSEEDHAAAAAAVVGPSTSSSTSSSTSDLVQVLVSTPAKSGKKRNGLPSTSKSAASVTATKFNKVLWRQKSLIVHELSGHDDLVLSSALSVESDLALTASRDTRVVVWRMSTREQLSSLRGHTGAVCGVAILPRLASGDALRLWSKDPEEVIALSGSLDCSLKVWNLSTGSLIKSIYTYNGIKCLGYCQALQCAVTGTEGGKLEFFSLCRDGDDGDIGRNVCSISAHDDSLTVLDTSGNLLASGSRDGVIKVWEAAAGSSGRPAVKCLYVSERVRTASDDHSAHQRCILSMKFIPGGGSRIVYGDSGCNIKILDWRNSGGLLHKLPNHVGDVGGFTDCLAVCGNILLASSYNLDTGLGHVNAFHLRRNGEILPGYVCSYSDDETSRVFSLACAVTGGGGEEGAEVTLLTAGKEVKLWRTIVGQRLPDEDALLLRPTVLPLFTREVVDSGSSEDSSGDDDDDVERHVSGEGGRLQQDGASQGWRCSLL